MREVQSSLRNLGVTDDLRPIQDEQSLCRHLASHVPAMAAQLPLMAEMPGTRRTFCLFVFSLDGDHFYTCKHHVKLPGLLSNI